jgi:DNA-directed RNA polymerase subunit RPC12/RpoP
LLFPPPSIMPSMGTVHAIRPEVTGPEFGDGDDDDEKLVCPNCDCPDFNLIDDEWDEDIMLLVCANCGQEIAAIPVED